MKFIEAFDAVKKVIHANEVTFNNDFAIQITLANKDCGGTFYIAVNNSVLSIEPYDYFDNDVSIDILWGDLTKIIAKKMDIERALNSEKLKYSGNIEIFKDFIDKIPKPLNAEEKAEAKTAKTIKRTKNKQDKKINRTI